jgi:hypothetical protein
MRLRHDLPLPHLHIPSFCVHLNEQSSSSGRYRCLVEVHTVPRSIDFYANVRSTLNVFGIQNRQGMPKVKNMSDILSRKMITDGYHTG